ncbi:MAG: 16S rRNA (guanine(966)-N(2))-methyltransferase RsmD [Acidobacteria bacterium]|nr:16S rRNA (guanine(966)-N(2))-methyltransferase RsmD [Acidobacteriota bacterium]
MGFIRVIAGAAKGRKLETPSWEGLRPTSDRLRETLFNILAPHVAGARVLDGYAGTGALGIEALSRGAAHVTFVERDVRAVKLIGANLTRAGFDAGAPHAIVRAGFIEAASDHGGPPFDVILLDPPYDDRDLDAAVDAAGAVLSDDGVIVLEHATRVAPPAGAVRTVKAGDSSLSFYDKRDAPAGE